MSSPSCAVATRIQAIESPYLNEFIYWYKRLGFDKIYFLNTEADRSERIRSSIADEFLEDVLVLEVPKESHNEATNYLADCLKGNVGEDYVLNVDSDELLYLDRARYSCIQEFLAQYSSDRFFSFEWINVPCLEVFCTSMVCFLMSDRSRLHHNKAMLKSLGSVEDIEILDWHVMNGGKRARRLDPFHDRCFVLHFIVRSLSHQILKQRHQQMNNFKERNGSRLREFLASREADSLRLEEYPFRMVATMVLESISRRDDDKEAFEDCIGGLSMTPERYRARWEAVMGDVTDLLGEWFPEERLESLQAVTEFLRCDLALERKLDIRKLPEGALVQGAPPEPLWRAVERVYALGAGARCGGAESG